MHLVHQHFTRQASKGNLFRHIVNTTQYGIRSAKYTGTILWNNLPMYIKDSSSKVIFKKKNCIKCLLNLSLKDKPTISAYIILRVSDWLFLLHFTLSYLIEW